MFYYLTKILPLLVMPVFVTVAASLLALCFLLLGKRRPAIILLVMAISLLWISSLPAVAARLVWSLQSQFPPVTIEEIPRAECGVVLGGALGRLQYPRVDIELTEATDRVYQTAKLFRAGKIDTVIVAAGNQPWSRDEVPEARLISDLLIEWGVPADSIVMDISSKNTRENALNAAAVIDRLGCGSTLLVTSASHMPRAFAAFQRAGVDTFPVAVDVISTGSQPGYIMSLIPQAGALAATSGAIREWIGIWVYRWRGWN
jgi:uncharacterized SAM-binding protein YcdF (DUF218 family)